jgi:hypothetical protein
MNQLQQHCNTTVASLASHPFTHWPIKCRPHMLAAAFFDRASPSLYQSRHFFLRFAGPPGLRVAIRSAFLPPREICYSTLHLVVSTTLFTPTVARCVSVCECVTMTSRPTFDVIARFNINYSINVFISSCVDWL